MWLHGLYPYAHCGVCTPLCVVKASRRRREAIAAMARQLRVRKSGQLVAVPALATGCDFHLFLSHTWSQGQSEMRVVKDRLVELLPGAKAFLDVDDLASGVAAEHVDRSEHVLCFCTRRYFESQSCAREVLRAVLRGRPLIALLEPERTDDKGGLGPTECRQLLEDDVYAVVGGGAGAPKDRDWSSKWDVEDEVRAGDRNVD